jgi:hypothetical protein
MPEDTSPTPTSAHAKRISAPRPHQPNARRNHFSTSSHHTAHLNKPSSSSPLRMWRRHIRVKSLLFLSPIKSPLPQYISMPYASLPCLRRLQNPLLLSVSHYTGELWPILNSLCQSSWDLHAIWRSSLCPCFAFIQYIDWIAVGF